MVALMCAGIECVLMLESGAGTTKERGSMDREKWLAERRKGVGGSDIAAVLGIHPYMSAFELYLEKRGELPPKDLSDNQAVHFGNVLEDTVAQEYTRRTGRKVARVNRILQHPKYPWVLANIDRRVVGEKRVLECKTADRFTAHQWGEEGTDTVPDHYFTQVQWYMGVTGAEIADLAVLIGGNQFTTYTLERDDELIEIMLDRADGFWKAVQNGIPPHVDGSASVGDALKRMYPFAVREPVLLPDDMARWNDQLRVAKKDVGFAQSRVDEAKHHLQLAAGKNSELMLPMPSGEPKLIATWRQNKDGKKFDAEAFKAAHPGLFKEFIIKTPGARVFLTK